MSEKDIELDDQQLFDDAVTIQEDETPIGDEQPVVEQAGTEQPRDEAGKFTTKDDGAPQLEAEKPLVDDNAPHVPSWRVREINDEKRQIAAELEALRAEKAQWATRQPEAQKPPAAERKPERPDPLLDPDGYAASVREEIRQELLAERRETSLQNAHAKYKEEFDEAYKAAQQHVDPALKARMQQSRDPGETLIQWHREQKTMREVGTDPNAWLEKKLKDPAFLARAVELARGSAQPQQTNGRPAVSLPPSLNGASRSNAALKSLNDDLSDNDLFEQLTG